MISEKFFRLKQLVAGLKAGDHQVDNWKKLEEIAFRACREQDPYAKRNTESHPDILLSNSFGIECKMITRLDKDIHLNSSGPSLDVYYLIAYVNRKKIKDLALVSGCNFYCEEIQEIKKVNTSMQNLSNPNIRYRNRIMWQIKSPFVIWGGGSFVVDDLGCVHTC